MKKYVIALLMIAAISFSRCKKDDKNDKKLTSTIVGKWFIIKDVESNFINDVKKEEHTDDEFTAEDYYEFKSNGTGVFSEVGDSDSFTYKVTGTTITITENPNESYELEIKNLNGNDAIFIKEFIENFEGVDYKTITEMTVKK